MMRSRELSALWFASIMLDSAGRFPTFDEIRHVVGLKSLWGAVRLVNVLIQMGYVSRPSDNNGSASITEAGHFALRGCKE